jgi:hypothetical protein
MVQMLCLGTAPLHIFPAKDIFLSLTIGIRLPIKLPSGRPDTFLSHRSPDWFWNLPAQARAGTFTGSFKKRASGCLLLEKENKA